jgi:hypothetical protein
VTPRRSVSLAAAALVVTTVGACSADHVTIRADAAAHRTVAPYLGTSVPSPTRTVRPDTAALRAVDEADGTPLTSDVTLQNDTIVVEPVAPAALADAIVNLATARATTRIDAKTPRSAPLTCRIGVLSETVDGQVRVDHLPVWMCFQVAVLTSTTFDGPATPVNTVTFVDATTGEWLFTNEDPA